MKLNSIEDEDHLRIEEASKSGPKSKYYLGSLNLVIEHKSQLNLVSQI